MLYLYWYLYLYRRLYLYYRQGSVIGNLNVDRSNFYFTNQYSKFSNCKFFFQNCSISTFSATTLFLFSSVISVLTESIQNCLQNGTPLAHFDHIFGFAHTQNNICIGSISAILCAYIIGIDPLHATSQSCTSVYLCTRWRTANSFRDAMYTRRSDSVDTIIGKLCRQVSWSSLLPSLYQRYEKGYLSSNMASSHVIVTSRAMGL